MMQFGLQDFTSWMIALGEAEAIAGLAMGSDDFEDDYAVELSKLFRRMHLYGAVFELKASAAAAERAGKAIVDGLRNKEKIMNIIKDVRGRLEDELAAIHCLYIDPEKMKFYQGKLLFGEDVHLRFPEASADIEQAGACFGLSRNTASVFHLMRVMEVGLEALKNELGVTQWSPSWNSALGQIRGHLLAQSKKKLTPQQRRRNEFVDSAAGYVQSVAVAWRNPTMHRVERNYDEEEARDVWNAVRAFMRYLTKNLKPRKTRKARP